MALKKLYKDYATGISEEEAYYKIMRVIIWGSDRVTIVLGIFKEKGRSQPIAPPKEYTVSKEKDESEVTPFDDHFSIEVLNESGSNIIKNAYKYLTSLPEFSDSEDVLEEA